MMNKNWEETDTNSTVWLAFLSLNGATEIISGMETVRIKNQIYMLKQASED